MLSLLDLEALQQALRDNSLTFSRASALLWNLVDDRPLVHDGYPGVDDERLIYKQDPDDAVAYDISPPFITEVERAIQLVESMRPDWRWMIRKNHPIMYTAVISVDGDGMTYEDVEDYSYTGRSGAYALCVAFVDALVVTMTREFEETLK